MNIKGDGMSFASVANKVTAITDTMENVVITNGNQDVLPSIVIGEGGYSEKGFDALGKTVGFPANFLVTLNKSNPQLAETVLRDRVGHYFEKGTGKSFVARRFLDMVCGIVSERYSYFDDCEVIDILSHTPLAQDNIGYQNVIATPERFHVRAIDKESEFTIGGDDSRLYFVYFIDNSMVGGASFRVQLGVYRLACTNGMIVPMKEFTVCHQVHRGVRDIAADFTNNMYRIAAMQDKVKAYLETAARTDSFINGLSDEDRNLFLSGKLQLNRKETEKVLELYEGYGGKTAWQFGNAVTELARDIADIDRRERLEKQAYSLLGRMAA